MFFPLTRLAHFTDTIEDMMLTNNKSFNTLFNKRPFEVVFPARSLFAVSSWLASELRQARAGLISFATFLNRCIGARSFTGRAQHFFSIGDENDLITLQRKCIDSIGGCGRPIISLLLVSFFLPSVKVKSSVPGLERIWHI